MLERLLSALATAGLAIGLVTVPVLPSTAAELHCTDEDTADDDATPYYNGLFDSSHALSPATLANYVPQGLTTWRNYFGTGHDLLLMSAYAANDGRAILQGVDQRDGSLTHRAVINTGHAGGVAVHGGYVYVSGPSNTVRKYEASAVASRLRTGQGDALDGTSAGDVYGAGFLAIDGDTLFAGRFSETGREWMGKYTIRADGNLSAQVGNLVQVPSKTQGLLVLNDHFVFSSSWGRNNRSNLYVVGRGYRYLDSANEAGQLRCFRAPTMTEGVTASQGKIYLSYESGAAKYANADDKPDRIIRNLHVATRSDLPLLP